MGSCRWGASCPASTDGSSVLASTGPLGPSLPRRYTTQHWRQPRATACRGQCPRDVRSTCKQTLGGSTGQQQEPAPAAPGPSQRRPQPFPTAASDQATRSGHGNRCSLPDPGGVRPGFPSIPGGDARSRKGANSDAKKKKEKNHRPKDAGQPTQTLSWTTSVINLAVWSSRHSAPFRFVTRPPTRGNKQWTQRWPRNRQCRAARDPGFPHAGSWWRLRGDGMYFCLLSKGCARHHSRRSRRPSSHLKPEIANPSRDRTSLARSPRPRPCETRKWAASVSDQVLTRGLVALSVARLSAAIWFGWLSQTPAKGPLC